jgi:diguanylate cyclase (GGDEF)-like protein
MCRSNNVKYLRRELERYKKLSLIDPLTTLYNRRKLDRDLKTYLAKQKRYNDSYNVMMIDIDNFKKINDTKGHKAGDRVLKKVAKVLTENIRTGENCYRLSGDEFVVIVRGFYPSALKNRLEEVLRAKKIEVSIGFSPLSKTALKKADEHMYYNKRSKKNV